MTTEYAVHMLGTEWAIEHRKADQESHVERWRRELEEERAIFSRQYKQARKAIPEFDSTWEEMRTEHNNCARSNLENNGNAYVIPVMHEDGTHEKVGPKDGPWDR